MNFITPQPFFPPFFHPIPFDPYHLLNENEMLKIQIQRLQQQVSVLVNCNQYLVDKCKRKNRYIEVIKSNPIPPRSTVFVQIRNNGQSSAEPFLDNSQNVADESEVSRAVQLNQSPSVSQVTEIKEFEITPETIDKEEINLPTFENETSTATNEQLGLIEIQKFTGSSNEKAQEAAKTSGRSTASEVVQASASAVRAPQFATNSGTPKHKSTESVKNMDKKNNESQQNKRPAVGVRMERESNFKLAPDLKKVPNSKLTQKTIVLNL
ncbi:hypothetical protein HK098_004707 [Nowakowskiella sp. JEL0407]|nr:hypothetical protein HK098_004707 [Nowakowskiella sp. JEL0407]